MCVYFSLSICLSTGYSFRANSGLNWSKLSPALQGEIRSFKIYVCTCVSVSLSRHQRLCSHLASLMRLLAAFLLVLAPFEADLNVGFWTSRGGEKRQEWRESSKTWQQMGSGQKRRCEKLRQGRLDSGACNEGVNHKTKMQAGGDKRRKRSGESRKAVEIWFGVCVECYIKEIISCLCCVTAALFLGAEMHCCRLWCGFWFNSLLWDQSLHGYSCYLSKTYCHQGSPL